MSLSTNQGQPYSKDEYVGKQFVEIDLHRPRSGIVHQTDSGGRFSAMRIIVDPIALLLDSNGASPTLRRGASHKSDREAVARRWLGASRIVSAWGACVIIGVTSRWPIG